MANSIEEILGKQINSVKELKNAIKELQDSLVGVDSESEQFKTTSEQLAAAQAELNKVTKAGKADNDAATDSIRGMEQAYKALYDQYKLLSEEQRNSDFGKNMAASLEEMSTKINDAKKEVGNFSSNIGRYAQGATEAFQKMGISVGGLQTPLKMASSGAKTFGTALKSLAANPIVLVITALVAILAKAIEAIKKNEELTNRLKEAFSVFQPVLDAVANAFDFLAGIIVKVVEGMAKVGEKILSIIPGYKEAAKSHKELAKATNDLTKAQREADVENSKKTAEIERLREEASETENVVEKKKLLEEAKAMQAEIDQKNIELAQEELRILQEYGEKTANSAEENEKLAAAQKKVNDAIAQGERNMRQYNKQLDAAEKGSKSAASSGKNYREEAKKLYEQLVEENKDEITKITEKYEKEKKLLEKYHLDTKLLTKKYNKEVAEIRKNAALEGLKQQKADLDKEWELWRRKGEEDIALALEAERLEKKAIPAVKKLDEEVGNFLKSFRDMSKMPDINAVFEGMEKVEEIIDKGGFSAFNKQLDLMKEAAYKVNPALGLAISRLANIYQNIQDEIDEVNASYGLSISTTRNLNTSLEELKTRLAEVDEEYKKAVQTKAGNEAFERIDKRINTMTEGLYASLYNMFTNNDYKEIYEYAMDFASQVEYTQLEVQKSVLEEELANFQGTQEQKIQLLQQYYGVVEELRNRDLAAQQLNAERSWAIYEAANDHFLQMHESLDSILSSIQNVMQAEVNSGQLTEKEAKKKKDALKALQAVQLAVAISNIAANTAAGIMDVWRGYSAELPMNAATAAATGPYTAPAVKAALDAKSLSTAIIRTATIGSQGTAQLAAAIGGYIANKKSAEAEEGGGSAGVGVGATPMLIDSQPYSYTRTVQTTEEEDELNRPIWCSIVDIENALGHQAVVKDESSF